MQMQYPLVEGIPPVLISPEGIFKYILIQVFIANKLTGYLVRGSTQYDFHAKNYKGFGEELKKLGFEVTKQRGKEILANKGKVEYRFICPGGGRIEHNYKGVKCQIYGYSKTFGRVDHKIAQDLISKSLGYPKSQVKVTTKQY